MSIPFIDLKTQYSTLKPQIQERINRVLDHGQFIMGPEVKELEDKLAIYTGSKHCITVASGTEALLISLMALGICPGDEVITTPFTFVATVEVIVRMGAIPIYVDIEPDTCNINANLIEAKITDKTRAIITVSIFGQPADMDEINAIASRHGNIPVIEDAAQSFGSTYKAKKSCNLSSIGCTSFFPSKPLGCYGDGGAIFTNDEEVARTCREIRVHGQTERYVHHRIGVGGRMDTLQCAILLAKFENFGVEVIQREAIAKRYSNLIQSHAQADSSKETIHTIHLRSDRTSVYAQYTILDDCRNATLQRLSEAGIPTAIHYPLPINEQPAYSHLCCPDCTPFASQISKKVLSLPMFPTLTKTQQDRIVEVLRA